MRGNSVIAGGMMGESAWSRLLNTPITAKVLIYIELVYVVLMRFATTALGFPGAISFLLDGLNILAILCSLSKVRDMREWGIGPVVTVFAVYCFVLLVSDVLNGVRPALIVWAIRNTFRLFGFFFSCAILLDRSDIDRIFRLLFGLQVVNLAVSLVQFGAMGIRQDDLGGIFGIGEGCNAYSNVFFAMLLVYYSFKWLDGEKGGSTRFYFVVISTLVLAALAELKVYFIEFVLLVSFVVVMRASKARAYIAVAVCICALVAGLQVFKAAFPDAYRDLMDFDKMAAYSSEGMAGYELSRFGAFDQIDRIIFGQDPLKELFGIGFGAAEESSLAIFTSDFSKEWGWLNYRWFTHQMAFIETGYIGFGLFVSLFISYAIWMIRAAKSSLQEKTSIQFSLVMTLLTVINIWYNCATRIESCYFIAFALAVGLISYKAGVGESHVKGLKQ